MTALYLDTSALVKRYLVETGTAWIRTLLDPSAGNTVVISEVALVEAAAALAARQRGGFITLPERDAAVDLVLHHADTEYTLAPLTRAVIDTALNLTQRHRLRGYDAVQLAAALLVADAYHTAGLVIPLFVAADADLLVAAHTEGLQIANPNDYP